MDAGDRVEQTGGAIELGERVGKIRVQGVSVAFSGSRLAAARLAAGLTQGQLARAVHSEQTRVSEWERGVMSPRPELIPKLAAAIGVDALEFLAANPAAASLEDMRLAAGMTMQSVAHEIGISLRRYRGVELGSTRRDPSEELVAQLAQLFAVPITAVRGAIDAARL